MTLFGPGIQSGIIKWLQYKLQLSVAEESNCVLMLDNMTVRKCLEYDDDLRSVTDKVCKSF